MLALERTPRRVAVTTKMKVVISPFQINQDRGEGAVLVTLHSCSSSQLPYEKTYRNLCSLSRWKWAEDSSGWQCNLIIFVWVEQFYFNISQIWITFCALSFKTKIGGRQILKRNYSPSNEHRIYDLLIIYRE